MKKKKWFLISLTAFFSFAGGFYWTAFPDHIFLLTARRPLQIGIPVGFSLPPPVRRAIFENSGNVLNPVLLASKAAWETAWTSAKLDLALVPRGWIPVRTPEDSAKEQPQVNSTRSSATNSTQTTSAGSQADKPENRSQKSIGFSRADFFRKEISSDFIFDADLNLPALPLFWKSANGQDIELLYLLAHDSFDMGAGLKTAITSVVTLRLWNEGTGWATTLSKLNDLDIAPEQKSSHLRSLNLSHLKIQPFDSSLGSNLPNNLPSSLPGTLPASVPSPAAKEINSLNKPSHSKKSDQKSKPTQ